MVVNLSPIGGVAAQFFDNSGNILSGGKIFTYAAGTTTPQATYTSSSGVTAHSNPIILDAAGRVPGGEIWLTDGSQYKFLIKTSTDVQIGSYDNIFGINSNFVNYTTSQEFQTATAGQTVFTLTTMQYQPGTRSLSVFVDGVNQYGPGALYAYQETSSTVVTFTAGLHAGADVKFTTSVINASSYGDAEQVSYTPPFTNSVTTNVELKLAQTISVKDFGATGNNVTDDTAAIQAAITAAQGKVLFIPAGQYVHSATLNFSKCSVQGEGPDASIFKPTHAGVAVRIGLPVSLSPSDSYNFTYEKFGVTANVNTTYSVYIMRSIYCSYKNIQVLHPQGVGASYVSFRVSGAVYLNVFETCVSDVINSVLASNGRGWHIGNGRYEVGNANADTNLNEFINIRAVRIPVGIDIDEARGCTMIGPDAEDCSTAAIHLRGSYNNLISAWVENGNIVVDDCIPIDVSGAPGAPAKPTANTLSVSYPSGLVVESSANLKLLSGLFNNVTINADAVGTTSENIDIGGTFVNSGTDCFLQYRNGGNSYVVVQNGANTVYSLQAKNNEAELSFPSSRSIKNTIFSNFEIRTNTVPLELIGSGAGLRMPEITDPGSSAANTATIFVKDDGTGRTQLMVRFPSGVAQQIAIQPP